MKIGYLVNDLSPSQLNFLLLRELNTKVIEDWRVAPTIFYENLSRPFIIPKFPIMQIADAYPYEGVLVATTLSTAEKLLRFPSAKKKYFLLWDLEWIRIKQKNYNDLKNIYCHPDLNLICRSEEHINAVENCWNRTPDLFKEFILNA